MFAHRTGAVLALFFLCLFALSAVAAEPAAILPRMVDLGAGKCIPCKKMAPILEEMQKDYAGVVHVVFVDVWKNPQAGKPYKIRLIPTQIFFDKAGKEVFRHEGFFSREEIEKVFLEKMGVQPIASSPKPEEKKTSGSLLPGAWDAGSAHAKAGSMSPSDAVG
jgi:thiol-disulfide isomerase/thioredoxin